MIFKTELLCFIGYLTLVSVIAPILGWYFSDEQKDKRALIRKAVRDSKHPVAPVYSERQRKHYGGPCACNKKGF